MDSELGLSGGAVSTHSFIATSFLPSPKKDSSIINYPMYTKEYLLNATRDLGRGTEILSAMVCSRKACTLKIMTSSDRGMLVIQ